MENKTKLTKEEITFKVLAVATLAVITCYFVPLAITNSFLWLLSILLFLPFWFWSNRLKRQKGDVREMKEEKDNTFRNLMILFFIALFLACLGFALIRIAPF